MTEELLPGLLIAVPILGATLPIALGLLKRQVGWSVAALVLAIEAVIASWLAYAIFVEGNRVVHVLGGDTVGRQDQEVGGFDTEGFIVGIELVADHLSGLIILLISLVSLAVLAYTRRTGPRGNAFYSGYLLLTGGLMGVVMTGDLFNMFVFLEIVGLATYALVASGRSASSAVAALKYLIIGTAGASLYLVGVGYIYVRTGTLNMVDVSRVISGEPQWVDQALYADPLIAAAFGFIAVGLATKAAIYPLHTWQPDAYAESPDAVTIYIAALVSTSAAYAFARITWNVFTPEFFAASATNQDILNVFLALAALSVLVGSVLAAMQRRVKRMFAYSSVAQFGLILIAIGVAVHPAAQGTRAAEFAVYGVVIHLVAHAVIKGGLFATAGAFRETTGARLVSEYAGLAKKRPFLSGAMAILGFGIIGVPPTVGFIGKWYIGVGAVEAELWALVFVVFASTLLTLLYVARLLEKLYFDYLPADEPPHAEASERVVADGGDDTVASDGGVRSLGRTGDTRPVGVLSLVFVATLLSVALGFGGAELTAALEPLVDAIEQSSPEVIP